MSDKNCFSENIYCWAINIQNINIKAHDLSEIIWKQYKTQYTTQYKTQYFKGYTVLEFL